MVCLGCHHNNAGQAFLPKVFGDQAREMAQQMGAFIYCSSRGAEFRFQHPP